MQGKIALAIRFLVGLIGLPSVLLVGFGGSAVAAAGAAAPFGGLATPADHRLHAPDSSFRIAANGRVFALEFEEPPVEPVMQATQAPVITSAGPFAVQEGSTTVATLTATDSDSSQSELTWSIPAGNAGGADAAKFELTAGGDLSFASAKDYESPDDANGDGAYLVTVQVSDGENSATADLRVRLGNVVELLANVSGPATISYAENGFARLGTYSASSSADRAGVTWTLSGDDSGDFEIGDGVLRFKLPPSPAPDYESPADEDGDNEYSVTVQAAAGGDDASLDVTVTVTDADEPGRITLDPTRPSVGKELTATLADPDGVTGSVTWKWERSQGRAKWAVISGATSAGYTPTAADSEQYLRVTASYADGLGSGRSAGAATSYPPISHELSALSITGSDRSMYPAFDSEVLHYAVECGAGDTMTLQWSAVDAAARVAINGARRAGQSGSLALTGLDGDDDIVIRLSGADGSSTAYFIHCLWEDFPNVVTSKGTGATEDLVGFVRRFQAGSKWFSHLMIIDNNGVPRYRARIDNRANHFRTHVSGADPYSYSLRDLDPNPPSTRDPHSLHVILDAHLNEVDRAWTVAPLRVTDNHDFAITPSGNYVLMSYEPRDRDFGTLTDNQGNRLVDSNDNPYSVERTRDSDIQIVTPAGKQVFLWSSWDHMAVEDCTQHRFPDGYAHINSLQYFDGDLIASFRGCSKVLRIDPDSGNTVWRVGRSYRTGAQWTASKEPAPLTIVGDPYKEFCGQHAARLLPNGNLLLFDNGGYCVVDPATGGVKRASHAFSRAVEYAIDTVNNEAIFQAHHSLHGEFKHYARSSGHVEAMEGGDWIVSWGRSLFDNDPKTGLPPDESATQVDPRTGVEKFSITVTDPRNETEKLGIRAYPLSPVRLAPDTGPLTATFPPSSQTSVFTLGASDSPKVLVAFNRPVVDFAATTPSLQVRGATIASVSAQPPAGEVANSFLFTLTPDGAGAITFTLVASQACASGGICAADGSTLTKVPAALVIGPPVSVGFGSSGYTVYEDGEARVAVSLSSAHRGVRGVAVPVAVGSETTASADDFSQPASGVTFLAGERTKFLRFAVAEDEVDEEDEVIRLELGTLPRGVRRGSTDETTVTIRNGPAPVVTGGGGGGGRPRPDSADFAWTVDRDLDYIGEHQELPTGLFLDLATMWLTESGPGADNGLYAYDLASGQRRTDLEFRLDVANRDPRGLHADGRTIWVSDGESDRLYAYSLAAGQRDRDREFQFDARNADAREISADGETLWVLDGGRNSVFAYRLADGALLGEHGLAPENSDPRGLYTDGVVIWVSDLTDRRIYAYRLPGIGPGPADPGAPAAGLVRVQAEDFLKLDSAGNHSPRGIFSDGDLMYVVDRSDDRIYTYNMPDAGDARLVELSVEGVLTDGFAPNRLFYRGLATADPALARVDAQSAQADARVKILPRDAGAGEGHQVRLGEPVQITVEVASPDGSRSRTYRVAIGGSACGASPERCRQSLALRAGVTVAENLYHDLAPGNPNLHHNISNLEVAMDGAVLRADFLDFFNRTGGVERWGFPTSEVVEIEPGALTQFFQRGAVDFHDVGAGWIIERRLTWDYVGGGLSGGADQGFEPAPPTPAPGGAQIGAFGHYVANFDDRGRRTGFLDFFTRLGGVDAFGFPKTGAREDSREPGTLLDPGSEPGFVRQYFQAAVFQLSERGEVELTLLGDTLRDRLVPGYAGLAAFGRGQPLIPGRPVYPAVLL